MVKFEKKDYFNITFRKPYIYSTFSYIRPAAVIISREGVLIIY